MNATKTLWLGLAAASCAAGSSANAKIVTCAWTSKQQCGAEQPCRSGAASITTTINLQSGAYRRCDTKGCDRYDGVVRRSGSFVVVDLPGRGSFAKIADDGSAIEVASLGTSLLIYSGRCK